MTSIPALLLSCPLDAGLTDSLSNRFVSLILSPDAESAEAHMRLQSAMRCRLSRQ